MKKILAFLLAVILAVTAFSLCSAKEINTMSEDVRYTLETETGDRKWLEGIKIRTYLSAERRINWESLFDPLGETESDIRFIKKGLEYSSDRIFGLDFMWYDIGFLTYEVPYINEKIEEAEKSLLQVGEETVLTFRMAEYYEYYPLFFDLELPDFYIQRRIKNYIDQTGTDYGSIPGSRAEGFIKKLNDFIKIPVREEDKAEVTVEKSFSGYSFSSTSEDRYNPTAYSACTTETLYFTVYNRVDLSGGKQDFIDMSLIPGGNGIYSVPFSENDIFYEEMKNVYPLPEYSTVVNICADAEKSLIFLMLHENDKYILKVIDEKTYTDISVLELFGYTSEDWVSCHFGDDFAVFVKNDFEIKTVAMQDDGTFAEVLEYTIPEENEYGWSNFPYESVFEYDGKRLIIVIPEKDRYTQDIIFQRACGLDILIFADNTLKYHGKWSCSLGEYSQYKSPFVEYIDEKIKIEL